MGISLHNLTVGYDRHPAVHHVTGTFGDATLTAIIGPNGGGKSTLLKSIVGILRPMSGQVELTGIKPTDIAYLPQQTEVDRNFPVSVSDVVAMGHWHKVGGFGRLSKDAMKHCYGALEQVGMGQFADRPVAALSSGQWQRVLFARLAVQNAKVILLDEPFAAIDSRTTHDLMHILQHWQHHGKTVIAVMHDLPMVKDHFGHALMLARELIGWGKASDVMCDENFARAMTLSTSWHEHADECRVEPAANNKGVA